MITENYLDEDVAYRLGLTVMRGQLYDHGSERGITIEFPFKSLRVEGYDQELHLQLSVNRIRDRIQELVESLVQVEEASGVFFFCPILAKSGDLAQSALSLGEPSVLQRVSNSLQHYERSARDSDRIHAWCGGCWWIRP